ncbi:Uncharacterised protein [uncultured archaeon]|nr:Uncharacterised protein [uncultured archaeon]
MNETNKPEQMYENNLAQIVKDLAPRVPAEKSGLTQEQYAKFMAQRPYELSTSSDHSDWAGASD